MSVINGQKADAITFNSAFGSKQDDNTFQGKQTLARVGSGSTITDAQQAINDVIASDALKIPLAQKGVANGVATLGSDGKVPSVQLPSYVDDVIEVADFASLPPTGETGKIYVTLDTNYSYRWSGSVYVFIGRPIATTDDLVEGSTNKYFTDGRARIAVITQVITNGVTDRSPSEDAVFDALALKLNTSDFGSSFNSSLATKTTDNVTEGLTNKYFTDGRAQTATISQVITNGVTTKAPSEDAVFDALALKFDSSSFNGSFDTRLATKTTDNVAEGTTNKYFTDGRAQTAVISSSITNGVTDKAPSSDAVFDALALKQDGIQFKDDGSNLGTAGTVTEIDFVGPGVTAARVGNAVSVTINATGTGGGWAAYSNLAVTNLSTISIVPATGQAKWLIQASTSAGAMLLATPFGATPPTGDGSMIRLVGNSDDNWVEVQNADVANGVILNGGPARLHKFHILDLMWEATHQRYIEVNRNF
jgi:hypothetical protein